MADREPPFGEWLPTSIKILRWLYRSSKRHEWSRKIARDIRAWGVTGLTQAIHVESIHAIRSFAIRASQEDIRTMDRNDCQYLAQGIRRAFAQILEVDKCLLHCTVKATKTDGRNRGASKVYTIARSDAVQRDVQYYPEAHLAGHNSDFASLLGCDDRKMKWTSIYPCFLCNDLPKYINSFDCSRENWATCFKSAAVFPIRYTGHSGKTELFPEQLEVCSAPDWFLEGIRDAVNKKPEEGSPNGSEQE